MNTTNLTEGVVVLGFGPRPMDFFKHVTKVCGKDAVVDPQVATMAGANLAAGAPAALDALRARLQAGAIEHSKQQTNGLGLPPGAAEWLGAGERGMSSNTMFTVMTGFVACKDDRWSDPSDPDDFRRCELLLDAVPDLRGRMEMMRAVSPEWARLVDRWADIVRTFDEECPGWRGNKAWSAPKTYELMRSIIDNKTI